jgi:hypothetical protein
MAMKQNSIKAQCFSFVSSKLMPDNVTCIVKGRQPKPSQVLNTSAPPGSLLSLPHMGLIEVMTPGGGEELAQVLHELRVSSVQLTRVMLYIVKGRQLNASQRETTHASQVLLHVSIV